MAKLTTPAQPWAPFERERRHWVEDLGYPTLLNVRRGHDPQLRRWAKETQHCVYIGRATRGGYKTSKWHNPYPLRAERDRATVLEQLRHPAVPLLLLHADLQPCLPPVPHGETSAGALSPCCGSIQTGSPQCRHDTWPCTC